jgi:hypothetical protein
MYFLSVFLRESAKPFIMAISSIVNFLTSSRVGGFRDVANTV